MRNLQPKLAVLLIGLCLSLSCPISEAKMRIGTTIGIGQAQMIRSEANFVEGPGAMSAFAEYVLHSRLAMGADHTRTWQFDEGELSTAVSLTGLTARLFPFSSMPSIVDTSGPKNKSVFIQNSWAPFIRGSVGFSQTSIRAKTFEQLGKGTSVGIYSGMDLGIEYILKGQLGITAQFGYSMNLTGTAQLQMLSSTLGLYFYF